MCGNTSKGTIDFYATLQTHVAPPKDGFVAPLVAICDDAPLVAENDEAKEFRLQSESLKTKDSYLHNLIQQSGNPHADAWRGEVRKAISAKFTASVQSLPEGGFIKCFNMLIARYKEHRNKHILTGGFGRTTTVVRASDKALAEINQKRQQILEQPLAQFAIENPNIISSAGNNKLQRTRCSYG